MRCPPFAPCTLFLAFVLLSSRAAGADEPLPDYLQDRGPGMPTPLFGTLLRVVNGWPIRSTNIRATMTKSTIRVSSDFHGPRWSAKTNFSAKVESTQPFCSSVMALATSSHSSSKRSCTHLRLWIKQRPTHHPCQYERKSPDLPEPRHSCVDSGETNHPIVRHCTVFVKWNSRFRTRKSCLVPLTLSSPWVPGSSAALTGEPCTAECRLPTMMRRIKSHLANTHLNT